MGSQRVGHDFHSHNTNKNLMNELKIILLIICYHVFSHFTDYFYAFFPPAFILRVIQCGKNTQITQYQQCTPLTGW